MEKDMNEIFETARLSYELGRQVYELLVSKTADGTHVIIAPMHIGDTIFVCAFVHAYKLHHRCNKVMLAAPEKQTDICCMFEDVNMVLPLDKVCLEALQDYIFINEYWNCNNVVYAHGRGVLIVKRDNIYIDQKSNYHTLKLSTLDYLGLPLDSAPKRMNLPRTDYSPELSEKYSHAVLLMPGAYSIATQCVPESFWVRLAKALSDAGIKVYTNYNGLDCEFIIDGTLPLTTGFKELVELSRYFLGFVGLRSGICDLIAETDAKLISIYPEKNEFIGFDELLEMSLLSELGRDKNIWNIMYSGQEEGKIIDEILDHLGR